MARPAPGARGFTVLLVAGLLAGCAVREPRTIEPAKVEAEFRGRSLRDPGLQAYLDRNRAAGRPAPGTLAQGDGKFSIGLAMTLPVLNRNEGPIAEARRQERAARVLAVQAGAIGEIERALRRYRTAVAEVAEADAALRLLEARERATARARELGEADRLGLVGVQGERALAARGRLEALRRVHAALGALEDAVQRPLAGGVPTPDLPPGSPR